MELTRGIENEQIEGRNAVAEAFRAGRALDKLYIASGENDRTLSLPLRPGIRASR